jgi:hypothetical protein
MSRGNPPLMELMDILPELVFSQGGGRCSRNADTSPAKTGIIESKKDRKQKG